MHVKMSSLWYDGATSFEEKKSKSIIHPFTFNRYNGLTINPYQGCGHRCGYCYATYEWSPEFYDKIYAKSNAAEVLERELADWKSDTINPVMVASATDAYQPAEVRYGLTRKCIKVLQKYNVPYIVFTKSSIIQRDLELHRKYKDNCFLIWSITTCDENVRRMFEPGTPPADRMFKVIKKFSDLGICCGVNIDPIIPLVTDGKKDLKELLGNCKLAGVRHVFGSIMRIRIDIWERMKFGLKMLGKHDEIEKYKEIYNFVDPLDSVYHNAGRPYTDVVMGDLKGMIKSEGMESTFPKYICSRRINKSHFGQTALLDFLV